MGRRLGVSGARRTARRSPRKMYVTLIQFNKNQNKCSISHKTPHCQPNVYDQLCRSCVAVSCLQQTERTAATYSCHKPVPTGQRADIQEPGVEGTMASDVLK